MRAWLLHEANRGINPKTRSTELRALRRFYRYLISERPCEVRPAADVNIPSPTFGRVELYLDAEANSTIEWAASQPGVRWQVAQVILLTLRYTRLRLSELINLRTDEVDLVARRISLVGKGRKPRVIPVPAILVTELTEYVSGVRSTLPTSPFFFINPLNHDKSGQCGRPALHNLARHAGVQAGVSGRHYPQPLAPHLRHVSHPPRRGHPRCATSDGSLQHRHDHTLPAPVGRGPECSGGPCVRDHSN